MNDRQHINATYVAVSLSGVLPEETANYTCQIDGPQNSVIGSVTHSVIVRGNLAFHPEVCFVFLCWGWEVRNR